MSESEYYCTVSVEPDNERFRATVTTPDGPKYFYGDHLATALHDAAAYLQNVSWKMVFDYAMSKGGNA